MRWDLLFENALVFDGSGDAPRREKLAVKDGKIAARGDHLEAADAAEVIDANGLWLTPGLLDIHTHFDLEVELAPGLPEAVRHGTTTVLVANCSLGLAYGNQRRNGDDPIVDCYARVENIPKPILRKVADVATWNSSASYLDHLDGLALGPNIAPMIPHSMLRIEVMGLNDSVTRDPTDIELIEMEELLEEGMKQGYPGFSTDALPFHYLANQPHTDKPIPGQFAPFKELKRLTNVVRKYDRLWQATPPKNSPVDIFRNFSLTSGRLNGKPLRVTAVAALDVSSNRMIVKLGMLITGLMNSALMNGKFRFQALAAPFKTWSVGVMTPLAEEVDALRVLNELDIEDRAGRLEILTDPEWQAAFKKMWRAGKSGFSLARLKRKLGIESLAIDRDGATMFVERAPVIKWVGESFADIHARLLNYQSGDDAAARDDDERAAFDALPKPIGDEAEFIIALFIHFDRALIWHTTSANRDATIYEDLLFHPKILPGFNDSGAHLQNMAFYDGNLRALKIAQSRGTDAVATMVRRLTKEPAEFLGLDAGDLGVGAQADIVLIDPENLKNHDGEEKTEWIARDIFDGEEQLVNRPDGVVKGVWIAGVHAFDGEGPGAELGRRKMGRCLRAANHAA